jgi:hypothetical protein
LLWWLLLLRDHIVALEDAREEYQEEFLKVVLSLS